MIIFILQVSESFEHSYIVHNDYSERIDDYLVSFIVRSWDICSMYLFLHPKSVYALLCRSRRHGRLEILKGTLGTDLRTNLKCFIAGQARRFDEASFGCKDSAAPYRLIIKVELTEHSIDRAA